MESKARSLTKAITWRIIASLATFLVAILFGLEAHVAIGIGAGDMAIKIGLYYLHERAWASDLWRKK